MADPFAPFRLYSEDGTHYLTLKVFDHSADVFEEAGCDGGGYGWHAVADALVRLHAPALRKTLYYDPEASFFLAFSNDRNALQRLARLLKQAYDNDEFLRVALAQADPDLLD